MKGDICFLLMKFRRHLSFINMWIWNNYEQDVLIKKLCARCHFQIHNITRCEQVYRTRSRLEDLIIWGKKEKEKCQNVEGKVLKWKKINCRKTVSLIGPSTTVNHQWRNHRAFQQGKISKIYLCCFTVRWCFWFVWNILEHSGLFCLRFGYFWYGVLFEKN